MKTVLPFYKQSTMVKLGYSAGMADILLFSLLLQSALRKVDGYAARIRLLEIAS